MKKRKSLLLLLTLPSLVIAAHATPKWKAALKTDTFANHTDEANVLSAELSSQGGIKLTNLLSLEGQIDLRWRTGRAQSWYGYDANQDGFRFKNAYLNFRPTHFLQVQAGAIDSDYLNTPTLIAATFPGVKESLLFGTKKLALTLSAFQGIPTSSSLNISRSEKEELPLFTVENIKLSYQNKRFTSSLSANHFAYKNLPSTVAYSSGFLGNNTRGQFENTSSFRFGFAGFGFTAQTAYNINSSLALGAAIERIENTEAAYGYGRSQVLKAYSDITLGDNVLTPTVELFFTESEAAPAYYNTSKYGNTNRQGYCLGLAYRLNDKGFKIAAQFVDADLIDHDDLVNSREQYFFLKLETLYREF